MNFGVREKWLVHPPQCYKTNVLVIAKYTSEFGLAKLYGATCPPHEACFGRRAEDG